MRSGACGDSRRPAFRSVSRVFREKAMHQEVAHDTGFRTSRLLSFQVPDWRRTRPSSLAELTVLSRWPRRLHARERGRRAARVDVLGTGTGDPPLPVNGSPTCDFQQREAVADRRTTLCYATKIARTER